MDDFSIWQTLLQTAVVGADRAGLPPPMLEELARRGIDIHASPEEVLLAAAALVRHRIRAGQVFPKLRDELPEPAPLSHGIINRQASRLLGVMLSGRFAPALPEWLELFSRSGLTLPPESLPALLNRCVNDPETRRLLEPHWDARARWLIRQNPAWAVLNEPAPGAEQKRLDRFIKQEKLDAKKISGLPEGELLEEIRQLADSCIVLMEKGKNVVKIPDPLPDWAFQHGLVRRRKGQDPAGLFITLLSWLPPRYWAERCQAGPADTYLRYFGFMQADQLAGSVVNATLLYGDPEWAEVLLNTHASQAGYRELSPMEIAGLAFLMPTEKFQQLIWKAYESNNGLYLSNLATLEQVMLNSEHPWPKELSGWWLKDVQDMVISYGQSWSMYDHRQKLRHAAFKVPPDPDASWMRGWEQIPQHTLYIWKDDIDYFLRVLRFRIDMHEAFRPS